MIDEDEVVGTISRTCYCGDEHEVEVTRHDLKVGFVVDQCHRTGSEIDIPVTKEDLK